MYDINALAFHLSCDEPTLYQVSRRFLVKSSDILRLTYDIFLMAKSLLHCGKYVSRQIQINTHTALSKFSYELFASN